MIAAKKSQREKMLDVRRRVAEGVSEIAIPKPKRKRQQGARAVLVLK
jgi:hypothetical protein